MRDGLVERRERGQRRFVSLLRRIAQMLVEPAVRLLPCSFVAFAQSLAEPFARERMRIERARRTRVLRRQQPYVAQPRHGAIPFRLVEAGERLGQAGDGQVAQGGKTIGRGRTVEQADEEHDRLEHGLAGEPFLLDQLHDPLHVFLAETFGAGRQCAEVIAAADVAALRLAHQGRQQG